jgi:hypothetical protein
LDWTYAGTDLHIAFHRLSVVHSFRGVSHEEKVRAGSSAEIQDRSRREIMIAAQRIALTSLALSGMLAASFLLMQCVIAMERLGNSPAGFW